MLTPDQLAAIRERTATNESDNDPPCTCSDCVKRDFEALLNELERLTRHNQRMAAALAQLSDSELWDWRPCEKMEGATDYIYCGSDDPQQLAERALVEDE